MNNPKNPFHDVSDHSTKSILTRACFSFSDRKGHSTELKMGQDSGYYANNLEEYLDVFEIEIPKYQELFLLSDILEKFGQCCKNRDVFYFWVADPTEKPPVRKIWK